jgi:hypothetical protein
MAGQHGDPDSFSEFHAAVYCIPGDIAVLLTFIYPLLLCLQPDPALFVHNCGLQFSVAV